VSHQIRRVADEVDIIVVRSKKDGTLGTSKPCVDCLQSIREMGVSRVYYVDSVGEIRAERVADMSSVHVCAAKRCLMHSNMIRV